MESNNARDIFSQCELKIARAKRQRQFEFVMWVVALLCVIFVNVLFWSVW